MSSSSDTPSSSGARLLDIFSAPTEANEAFLSTASALVDFLDRQSTHTPLDPGYDAFGAFELSGLKQLAQQYGASSEAYTTAVKTLQAIFASAVSQEGLNLAVVTFSTSSQEARKRADPPQSPFPPPIAHPAEPIGSTCFLSEDACTNATDSCSGHGECVGATKAGRTCYICACSASLNEQGRKEEWAGVACERKDVSGCVIFSMICKEMY